MRILFIIVFLLLIIYGFASCLDEYYEAISNNRIGMYIPQCYKNDTWVNPQCHGGTGFCWCVDDNGDKKGFQERIYNLEC